ncbi:MAG TPA: hypothetical protein VIM57_02805 [Luteolibacter sp.]
MAFVLLLGGAAFGIRTFKQNRPAPFWVKISVRLPPDGEQLEKLEKEIRQRAQSDEVIGPVVRELDLARRWNLPSEEMAAAELRRRMFVRFQGGDVLEIGLNGKRKEMTTTSEIAKKLGDRFMATTQRASRSSF